MTRDDHCRRFWEAPAPRCSLLEHGKNYLSWMERREYSAGTIGERCYHLRDFIVWCRDHAIETASQLNEDLIIAYQTHLYQRRSTSAGQHISTGYRDNHLNALVMFLRYLVAKHHIAKELPYAVERPRSPRRIPRRVLSLQEIEKVLQQPDITTKQGIRDRAVIETCFSTGLRRSELAHLKIPDIDFSRGTVTVTQGKGKKTRVVPIGERALIWLRYYLDQVRPTHQRAPEDQTLFLTQFGKGFTDRALTRMVTNYIKQAKVAEQGSCHLIRHSMATLMLENGADIRYIQEILGHASLNTTQIYTKVAISKLKQVHQQTHPAKDSPDKTQEILQEIHQTDP